MRRFLIFAPLWSCLFLAGQVTVELVNHISFWLRIRFQPPTDFYIHINSKSSLFRFVPVMAIGFVVGVVFAALDLSLNRRNDGGGGETLKRLVKHLFGSLVVAILFIIVSTGVKELLWNGYGMHRRYHAYPPDMELLNAFRFVPVLALAGAFLWAMNKSLRHP